MSIIRQVGLFVVVISYALFLSGCAVSYQSINDIPINEGKGSLERKNCTLSYSIIFEDQDWNNSKDGDFVREPYLSNYQAWVDQILKNTGCEGDYLFDDGFADLIIKIRDDFPYRAGAGQGEGILMTLTLGLIPFRTEYKTRSYGFYKNESRRVINITDKTWWGVYFIPFFPFSFYPYEENIFKSQLSDFLGIPK